MTKAEVARLFSLHSPRQVTYAAVRKWLLGTAIPSQDHLAALARLLGCEPAWLRFGNTENANEGCTIAPGVDSGVLRDLARLDDVSKGLVRGLVDALLALPQSEQ